jgi:hypothetical protein
MQHYQLVTRRQTFHPARSVQTKSIMIVVGRATAHARKVYRKVGTRPNSKEERASESRRAENDDADRRARGAARVRRVRRACA